MKIKTWAPIDGARTHLVRQEATRDALGRAWCGAVIPAFARIVEHVASWPPPCDCQRCERSFAKENGDAVTKLRRCRAPGCKGLGDGYLCAECAEVARNGGIDCGGGVRIVAVTQ